jgi:hypothetical protein
MVSESLNSIVSVLRSGLARRFAAICVVGAFLVVLQASRCDGSPAVVDTAAPSVRFEGVRQYSRAFTRFPVAVRAVDDIGVTRVEFYVDSTLVTATTLSPVSAAAVVNFSWSAASPGKHVLQAKAFDAAGNSRSTAVVVIARTFVMPTGNSIALVPSVRYQTMQGWEATDQAGQLESPAWNNYKTPLMDQAVNDLGLNRVRMEVPSGIENPVGYFSRFLAGQITYNEYSLHRYEIINDNSDPNVINPGGFQWAEIDHAIDNIILPLRQRLQARGETLWVNANYIDFGSSSFEHKTTPTEYAEFVLATYKHMQARNGFVPDSWEVVLEPDTATASWSAAQVAQAVKAAGDLLVANNFTPNFVGPSTTNAANAPVYIDQIAVTPGAMQHMGEFSYHRYAGVTNSVLQSIADRGVLHGKRTSMLEWIGADYSTLHQDLKLGRISSWQEYTLAFPNEPDNGAQYYLISDTTPSNPVLTIASRTKFLRQYFRFIRAGAQRIEAVTGNANFDPVAFINTNGKYVVVVKSTGGGTFDIRGLPAGNYGIKFTTATQYNVDLPDVAIGDGQALATSIPGDGVITVYAR